MATISIFIGSIRPGRQTEKVAKHLASVLVKRGNTVHLIDPLEHPEILTLKVPLRYNPKPSSDLVSLSKTLSDSDGFILVTPEYNHSFSGTLKDAIDAFMPEYKHKPFGIASQSIGDFGGVRANEALRQVVSELKGVPTPISLLVPRVQDVFNDDGTLKDKSFEERVNGFLDDFEWYVEVLKKGRI